MKERDIFRGEVGGLIRKFIHENYSITTKNPQGASSGVRFPNSMMAKLECGCRPTTRWFYLVCISQVQSHQIGSVSLLFFLCSIICGAVWYCWYLYHVIRFEAALRPWQFTIKRVLRIPSTKFLVLPSALYAKQYKRVAEYCTAG